MNGGTNEYDGRRTTDVFCRFFSSCSTWVLFVETSQWGFFFGEMIVFEASKQSKHMHSKHMHSVQ